MPRLVKFLLALHLPLSKPQEKHFRNLVDTLIALEGGKTIRRLVRQMEKACAVSSACDFVSQSPWSPAVVMQDVHAYLLSWALQRHPQAEILISADDTNAPKHQRSQGFEGADFRFDHTEGRYTFGYVVVSLHVSIADCCFAVSFRLYLREETVRKVNCVRQKGGAPLLTYRSKLDLVQEMLQEIEGHLPKDRKVYVLFDSWYASQGLIRFCRKHGWHVICALRSN